MIHHIKNWNRMLAYCGEPLHKASSIELEDYLRNGLENVTVDAVMDTWENETPVMYFATTGLYFCCGCYQAVRKLVIEAQIQLVIREITGHPKRAPRGPKPNEGKGLDKPRNK